MVRCKCKVELFERDVVDIEMLTDVGMDNDDHIDVMQVPKIKTYRCPRCFLITKEDTGARIVKDKKGRRWMVGKD